MKRIDMEQITTAGVTHFVSKAGCPCEPCAITGIEVTDPWLCPELGIAVDEDVHETVWTCNREPCQSGCED